MARVVAGADVEQLSKGVRAFFELKYGKSVRFRVGGDDVVIAQAKRFLTNMMLVSVAERCREIGIRKAVGATDAWIRRLFLAEALALCFVAGLLGLGLGFVAYESLIWLAFKATDKIEFV